MVIDDSFNTFARHLNLTNVRRLITHSGTLKLLLVISSCLCLIYFTPWSIFCQQKYVQSNASEITIDRGLFDYLKFHLRDTPYDGVANYTRFMITALGLKGFPDVEPLAAGMGLVVNDITSFRYPLSISPCRQHASDNTKYHHSLFVAVISAPDHFEKRATIRQTWLNHLRNQTNIYRKMDTVGFGFVVGLTNHSFVQRKIAEESEKYGDILQLNIFDTYAGLSVKGAGLLNWINTYCSPVDFVLKVDDDVYVNVHNLATVLHSLPPSKRSVYGRQIGGHHPARSENKWATSFEIWPWKQFPMYVPGAAMVIAGSAVRPLLSAIQTTPYFIWEDLYLIGLCAVKAGLHIRTSERIFVHQPENCTDPCFVRSSVLWTTQSDEGMNSSHKACDNFYRNPDEIPCLVDNKTRTDAAVESDFPFGYVKQN